MLTGPDGSGKSMKKCSTAAFLLAAALSAPAHAGPVCEFLPDAPEIHRVKPGDTLWGIASVFLQNPWCWPQVWEGNREQITNPHWIYPGQVLVLDRQAGRLRLQSTGTTRPDQTVRLSAGARVLAPLDAQPVPAVALPLLKDADRFRLARPDELAGAARIVGFLEGRQMASTGDTAFVTGDSGAAERLEVVRPLAPVRDPDDGKSLALPLLRIGTATYLKSGQGEARRVRLGPTRGEVMPGDLILPATTSASAMPILRRAIACDGKIAAMLREGGRGAPGDTVALNRGRSTGLDSGSLVAVTRQVRIGADDARLPSATTTENIATLLVFEAVEHSALALVLQSTDIIGRGDALSAFAAPD